MLRGIWGDKKRYLETYWKKYNNKFYITGDTARKDEHGNIWIMGRSDDVVNISGHRLGTMEIESAIVSHEYVAEAAVVSYKHEIKGEAIHAFVTLKNNFVNYNDSQFSSELREWVKKKLVLSLNLKGFHFPTLYQKLDPEKLCVDFLETLLAEKIL